MMDSTERLELATYLFMGVIVGFLIAADLRSRQANSEFNEAIARIRSFSVPGTSTNHHVASPGTFAQPTSTSHVTPES